MIALFTTMIAVCLFFLWIFALDADQRAKDATAALYDLRRVIASLERENRQVKEDLWQYRDTNASLQINERLIRLENQLKVMQWGGVNDGF